MTVYNIFAEKQCFLSRLIVFSSEITILIECCYNSLFLGMF